MNKTHDRASMTCDHAMSDATPDTVTSARALSAADIGMGTGAQVAVESVGVTLARGNLDGPVTIRSSSRATTQNIHQNLVPAFLYNGFGATIAAGVLYPFTGLLLSPMTAALTMSLSLLSMIGNALRLRAAKLQL